MSAAIQLTEAELVLITAQREAAEAARIKEEADKAEREAAKAEQAAKELVERNKARRKRLLAESAMVEKLLAEDPDRVFSVTWSTHEGVTDVLEAKVTYTIGGNTHQVELNEIVTTSGRYSLRVNHTGVYQYSISGPHTEYKTRSYKNPKSLVKKVKEFQEIADVVAARKKKELDLAKDTMELLIKTYPNAEVKMYEPNDWNKVSSKYYNTFHVITTKGTVSFTSDYREGELVLAQFAHELKSPEVRRQVCDLILAD